MSTITVDEVGIFRCKFAGFRPCKNEDYCTICLNFEGYFDGQVRDWESLGRPAYLLHTAEEAAKLSHLQEGHVYLFRLAVGFNRGSEKNGKVYSPGVRYKIIEAIKEAN